MEVPLWSYCGEEPVYPEETHMSHLATTNQTSGIQPASQWWEVMTPIVSFCLRIKCHLELPETEPHQISFFRPIQICGAILFLYENILSAG